MFGMRVGSQKVSFRTTITLGWIGAGMGEGETPVIGLEWVDVEAWDEAASEAAEVGDMIVAGTVSGFVVEAACGDTKGPALCSASMLD
jgi:hypothetical protein